MALLILVSSSGMSMDIHFCQDKIKRINLLGKAKSCSEISQELSKCSHHKSNAISCGMDGTHKGCCNNKSFDLDLDFDSGEIIAEGFTNTKIKFVQAAELSYLGTVIFLSRSGNYTDYHPPPLERDIAVLFQTFLL